MNHAVFLSSISSYLCLSLSLCANHPWRPIWKLRLRKPTSTTTSSSQSSSTPRPSSKTLKALSSSLNAPKPTSNSLLHWFFSLPFLPFLSFSLSFLFWVLKKIVGLYWFDCLFFFFWLLRKREKKKIEDVGGK